MKALNAKLVQRFLKIAGERLKGEWVMIGGTVLPALGIDSRVTTDIDLIALGPTTQADTLVLMEIAESLGLPVESINQAGAYFISKIKRSELGLVPLHRGKKATIFRPDATLFLRLKIGRLSTTDLQDCERFIRFAKKIGEPIQAAQLLRQIDGVLAKDPPADRRQRLEKLRGLIDRKA